MKTKNFQTLNFAIVVSSSLLGSSLTSSGTVITLPGVPSTVKVGGLIENVGVPGMFGPSDNLQVGAWTGSIIAASGSGVANVNLVSGTTYPFTFSYTGSQFSLTTATKTVTYAASGWYQNFVLNLYTQNPGDTVTVSGLALTGGTLNPLIDLSYSNVTTNTTFYSLPTSLLTSPFTLSGNFQFTTSVAGENSKVGFQVFADSAVPEPATMGFGAALVGGICVIEAGRRRKLANA